MVNLPADVLLLIFSLLSQNDKLECMTVCRHWERVLQYNLFQVIHIRNKDHFNYLVKRVKKDPLLGKKVEQITISSELKVNHDPTIFITLFPNVREFAIKKARRSLNMIGFKKVPEPPLKKVLDHPWCEHITKVAESNFSIYTKTLLHSGLCKNLTNLELTGEGRVRSIIKSLTNAPALKTFYLNGYAITFHDLELLHTVTPLLSSLLLDDVRFDPTPLPTNIKPVTSMKSFQYVSFHDFSEFNIRNPHLVYASKKYTQLEELIIWPDNLDNEEEYNPGLLEEKREQRELWKSYLKSLGPRLKSFSLILDKFDFNHSTGFNFELLDECGCQIRKLGLANSVENDMLVQLGKTTQVQYIQSLTVLLYPSYPFSFEWLLRFSLLKELVLSFPSMSFSGIHGKSSVDLTDVFGCLNASRLETLRLNYMLLKAEDVGKFPVYPSLKNLVLFQCKFEKGVDTCISRGFPSLKSLKLINCFQSIDHFMLLHTDLSYLQIVNNPVHVNSSILVITLGDGQRRLYSTSELSTPSPFYKLGVSMTTFDSPTATCKPFQKSDDTPMLTVVCNSVCDFSMKIESQYAYW